MGDAGHTQPKPVHNKGIAHDGRYALMNVAIPHDGSKGEWRDALTPPTLLPSYRRRERNYSRLCMAYLSGDSSGHGTKAAHRFIEAKVQTWEDRLSPCFGINGDFELFLDRDRLASGCSASVSSPATFTTSISSRRLPVI